MWTGSGENPRVHAMVSQMRDFKLFFVHWLLVRACPASRWSGGLLSHLRALQSQLVFCTQALLCGVSEGLCEPKTSAKPLFPSGLSCHWRDRAGIKAYVSDLSCVAAVLSWETPTYFSHYAFFCCLIKWESVLSLSSWFQHSRVFSYWLNALGNFECA